MALYLVLSILAAVFRIYTVLPGFGMTRRQYRGSSEPCSLAVFLGSGGHTTEALSLMSGLDFSRYTPRVYIISQGDVLSAQKVSEIELSKNIPSTNSNPSFSILTIPRARQVHQSLLGSLPKACLSLVTCIYLIVIHPLFRTSRTKFADILLINGPGTCFVLCVAVYVNKFLGLPASEIVYVESFARVKTLSLSGKLLRPLVDRFIVQWPQVLQDGGRGECHGRVV